MQLAGSHVLLTGATGAIGRPLAVRFAEAGARLTLVARGRTALEALAVEVLAPLWGVEPTLEAVKAITLDGIANVWDKNGNGYVCWKDLPNTPGNPTYVFIVKDDAATD